MGYPMTYTRVVWRSHLWGYYADRSARQEQPGSLWELWPDSGESPNFDTTVDVSMLRGDLRRLENDQRDEQHLARYAERAGITPEQAKAVLDALFGGEF